MLMREALGLENVELKSVYAKRKMDLHKSKGKKGKWLQ